MEDFIELTFLEMKVEGLEFTVSIKTIENDAGVRLGRVDLSGAIHHLVPIDEELCCVENDYFAKEDDFHEVETTQHDRQVIYDYFLRTCGYEAGTMGYEVFEHALRPLLKESLSDHEQEVIFMLLAQNLDLSIKNDRLKEEVYRLQRQLKESDDAEARAEAVKNLAILNERDRKIVAAVVQMNGERLFRYRQDFSPLVQYLVERKVLQASSVTAFVDMITVHANLPVKLLPTRENLYKLNYFSTFPNWVISNAKNSLKPVENARLIGLAKRFADISGL